MNKKFIFVLSLFVLLLPSPSARLDPVLVKATNDNRVHNQNTGLNYTSIQEAINAPETLNGHTIFVEAGTYYENVVVNKTLSLLGKNKDTTTIDTNGTSTVIHVSANNVLIKSFTIQNSGWPNAGIWIDHCFNVSISDVSVSSNWGSGIYGSHSFNISITNSNIKNNGGGGIHLTDSSNILIYKNNATSNGEGDGIRISGGSNVLVSGNNANHNGFGIYLTHSSSWRDCENISISGNNASFNQQAGISIHSSHNVSVLGNNAIFNSDYLGAVGIGVYSPHCLVFENNATKNYVGIYLSGSNCSVFGNNIEGNYHYDIKVMASGNRIFHNNLAKAVVSPSGLVNTWDDGYPSGGNYWSDYTGVDADGDGIGDTPYVIDEGNRDRYPLMGQAKPSGLPMDPTIFYTLIIVIIAIVAALAFFLLRRKKKPPEEVVPPQP